MSTEQASALPLAARRFADLVALSERRLGDAFGGRIARFYAWGIAGSYAFVSFVVASHTQAILEQALVALAWIPAGLVALGAARDHARLDEESGLVALVRQRGFEARDLGLARLLATALRIARVTGYPALALALVGIARARATTAVLESAQAALGAVIFVLCLSLLVAGLARGAAVVSGGRGRLLLVAFVLVPHLARSLFPWMPSVPSLLGGVLEMFFERSSG